MKRMSHFVWGAALGALAIGLGSGAAHAQSTATPQPDGSNGTSDPQADNPTDIVVKGIRQSLTNAMERKKNASQIVDSIVADDIGKLPDLTAVDALQRVPGVSITRDRGEGAAARIRGLSQVLTTIDGRESFTADGGRGYNLEDMPAELLGAIDVYKTPTAEQIEGGITGSIDLRTHLPFDFPKTTISGSFRMRYADLADKASPIYSGLISTRFHTSIGEIGFLVAAVNQYRTFRSDDPGWGGALGRLDVVPGQKVYLSQGDYEPLIYGKRHRPGVNAALQWRPASNFEAYAQFGYQKFTSEQQQYGFNAPLPVYEGVVATNTNTVVPGSVTLFPGTNDVQKATFNNIAGYTFGVERDSQDTNQQYATGFKWNWGRQEIKVDASYLKSTNRLYYSELDLNFVAPQTTFDYSGPYPQTTFSGINMNSLSSYTMGKLSLNVNNYKGDEKALRIDDKIDLGDGLLRTLKIGGRINRRELNFFDVIRYNKAVTAIDPSQYSGLFEAMPFDDFVSKDANVPRGYQVANPGALNYGDGSFDALRQQLGGPAVTLSPQSPFQIKETAKAAYAQLEFNHDTGLRFDGNVGVRYVRTDLITDSFNTIAGVITPYHKSSGYSDWLPSANIRFKFTDDFFLRLAYSKTLTRPSTQQLSPSLTLVPASGTGSGGNPDLLPLRSTGFDMSLEKYFGKTGSLYFAAFDRRVTNFIFTSTYPSTIDGVDYTISSPINGRYGHVRGLEVGGQAFFDFLPGPLSGFGAQGNFTYIDSDTDQVIPGSRTKLPGVPTKQFAAALLYEKYGFSSRLSYTWRNTAFSGTYTMNYYSLDPANPKTVISSETGLSYAKGYGWLDGSISYDFNKHITASLEFSNITGTNIQNNRGVTRPGDFSVDDRQVLFGIRFKY